MGHLLKARRGPNGRNRITIRIKYSLEFEELATVITAGKGPGALAWVRQVTSRGLENYLRAQLRQEGLASMEAEDWGDDYDRIEEEVLALLRVRFGQKLGFEED